MGNHNPLAKKDKHDADHVKSAPVEEQQPSAAPASAPEASAAPEASQEPVLPSPRELVAQLDDDQLAELLQMAQQASSYFQALQRTTADYDNYQKRVERERETTAKYAVQNFAKELLKSVDVFDKALQVTAASAQAQTNQDYKNLWDGMSLVQQELQKTLRQFGIIAIESVGKRFDPRYHEALAQQESTTHPEMTVIAELEKGYLLYDRVIKASKVVVSRKPKPPEPKQPPTQPNETKAEQEKKAAQE